MDALKFFWHAVLYGACFFFLSAAPLSAQVPRDVVVDVTASAGTSSPYITLQWSHRLASSITNYAVQRRNKGASNWFSVANLSPSTTAFADFSAQPASNYEYRVTRDYSNAPSHAYGYVNAGAGIPMVEWRGKLLLLIDKTLSAALAPEIAQLQQDLSGDGWTVLRFDVTRMSVDPGETNSALWSARSNELFTVKQLIRTNYYADPTGLKAVYLLGRIPVPYSGQTAPDGHPDHVGAWPADGFYADMEGAWTDNRINNVTSADQRNWNVPGDGKFDTNTYPVNLKLQLGRVDLSNMTGFPNSGMPETELLRRYLRRAHQYRLRQYPFVSVPRRGLVDDHFGWYFDEAFASVGWATGYSWFGAANVSAADWFGTLRSNQYAFAYGCGLGTPTNAAGIGTSTDFANIPSHAVFNVFYGSYFGDWDSTNNFMRASLAGTPDSEGLTCCWGDRPYWFLHHMALGENIGYSALVSQNNSSDELSYAGNDSPRGVHMALLGDLTLRLHPVFPVPNLHARAGNGQVFLQWEPSGDTNLLGYHVYRAAGNLGPFLPLADRLDTNTLSFTDASTTADQTYAYMVRAVKLETSAGGSYENLSQGAFVTVTATDAVGAPCNPGSLQLAATSSVAVLLSWRDNSSDETAFELQRQLGPIEPFVTLAFVPAGTTNYADPGPIPAATPCYYRVRAIGPGGNSAWSEEASCYTEAGQIQLNNRYFVADKLSGMATVLVSRTFGQFGMTKIDFSTENLSATNGIHFAPTNNIALWADGQSGDTTIFIPLPEDRIPKLARSFKLNISAPTNGALLGFTNSCEVVINDSSATLPEGWTTTNWSNGTYFVPARAAFAEGMFGETMLGGGLGSGGNGTNDCGQFIFLPVTGDGTITARVLPPVTAVPGAAAGVMIREDPAPYGRFAYTSLIVGSGAKMQFRRAPNRIIISSPPDNNGYAPPCWVRLSRQGSNFLSEVSADGRLWTQVATQTLSMNLTSCWGLASAGVGNDYRFVLSTFDHVSVAPNSLLLQWTTSNGCIHLEWPTWASGVSLHSAGNLTPPITWVPVTDAIVLTNGGAVIPVNLRQRFFQLRGP